MNDIAPLGFERAAPARPAFARWLGGTNDITRTFLAAGRIPGLINMAGGLPAPEIYPVDALAEIARAAVAEHPADTLGYGPLEGLPGLRDALAARFSGPGLRLGRENVLVTSGGLQALDLLGKVLLEDGGTIAGQFPTYLGALDAWRPRRPAFRDLLLEDPALDLRAALAGAQFAYTVPNFSNPTGRLVDDDPYGSLHYDAAPLPRMLALSAERDTGGGLYRGPVVYMGTVSKELAPGLRIGWVIADPSMIDAMAMAKLGADMCSSGLTQRVVLGAFESGLADRINPAIVALYRARRDALCAAMAEELGEWFTWEVPVGGMFVWAVARDPAFDTDRLLPAAMRAGVTVTPSSAFDPTGRYRRAIRINFTLNPPETLAEGVRRLATALRAMRP